MNGCLQFRQSFRKTERAGGADGLDQARDGLSGPVLFFVFSVQFS